MDVKPDAPNELFDDNEVLTLGSAEFDLWDLEIQVKYTQVSPSAAWPDGGGGGGGVSDGGSCGMGSCGDTNCNGGLCDR